MRRASLLGAVAAACAGFATVSHAQTTSDDPLHGYQIIDGVPTNTDNGTVTPLTDNPVTGFGFFVSPDPSTGTFYIDILTPIAAGLPGSFTLTGTNPGTATLFSRLPWFFPNEELYTYLGLPNGSPSNKCCGQWSPYSTGPYYVDQVDLGTVTLNKLSTSTMDDSITQSLAAGSIIVAFLDQGENTIDTANSGAPYAGTPTPAPTLLPSSWTMMALGLAGFGLLAYRHKRNGSPPRAWA